MLLFYPWHLVQVVQFIKNDDLRPLVHFFFKNLTVRTLGQCSKARTVHIFCSLFTEFGLLTLSLDTDKVLKKIYILKVKYYMNKIFNMRKCLNQMIFVRIYRIFSNFKMFNYYLMLSSSWVLTKIRRSVRTYRTCPNFGKLRPWLGILWAWVCREGFIFLPCNN